MPGMDGYELARRIRASPRGRNLVLVSLSGWSQADDKQRASDAGFDEHLTKPVDPDVLSRVLNRMRSAAA
jgi:CheY-like chemotaxis protein